MTLNLINVTYIVKRQVDSMVTTSHPPNMSFLVVKRIKSRWVLQSVRARSRCPLTGGRRTPVAMGVLSVTPRRRPRWLHPNSAKRARRPRSPHRPPRRPRKDHKALILRTSLKTLCNTLDWSPPFKNTRHKFLSISLKIMPIKASTWNWYQKL